MPVIPVLLLTSCSGPYSSLDPAGPSASTAALLWYAMFAYAAVVFVVVLLLWIQAARRPADAPDDPRTLRTQQRWILGGGVLLPMLSISLLLLFGIPMGRSMLPLPPADGGEAFVVEVTAHQWWWQVEYPGAGINLVDEMHIPAGVPVDVHLMTADVIHAFWVPRLAGKMDTIPGRTNVLRLLADEPGIYRGQCAEFCGLAHAHMKFTVHAHDADEFAAWQESVSE